MSCCTSFAWNSRSHRGTPRTPRESGGREAWLELERAYVGRAREQPRMQLFDAKGSITGAAAHLSRRSIGFCRQARRWMGPWGQSLSRRETREEKPRERRLYPSASGDALPEMVLLQPTSQTKITHNQTMGAVISALKHLASNPENRQDSVAFRGIAAERVRLVRGRTRAQALTALNAPAETVQTMLNGRPRTKRPPPPMPPTEFPRAESNTNGDPTDGQTEDASRLSMQNAGCRSKMISHEHGCNANETSKFLR